MLEFPCAEALSIYIAVSSAAKFAGPRRYSDFSPCASHYFLQLVLVCTATSLHHLSTSCTFHESGLLTELSEATHAVSAQRHHHSSAISPHLSSAFAVDDLPPQQPTLRRGKPLRVSLQIVCLAWRLHQSLGSVKVRLDQHQVIITTNPRGQALATNIRCSRDIYHIRSHPNINSIKRLSSRTTPTRITQRLSKSERRSLQ